MSRKIIEPRRLKDAEKVRYLAKMGPTDIYPTAFKDDNERTLISLLARRVVRLEERLAKTEDAAYYAESVTRPIG